MSTVGHVALLLLMKYKRMRLSFSDFYSLIPLISFNSRKLSLAGIKTSELQYLPNKDDYISAFHAGRYKKIDAYVRITYQNSGAIQIACHSIWENRWLSVGLQYCSCALPTIADGDRHTTSLSDFHQASKRTSYRPIINSA